MTESLSRFFSFIDFNRSCKERLQLDSSIECDQATLKHESEAKWTQRAAG